MRNKYHWLFKILCVVVFLITTSCKHERNEKWRNVEILPLDESQIITIITKDNNRYIMNGIHDKVPRDGYLLLDISKVDPLGDGVSVCWNELGYKWKISSAYAKLIENKLDTTNFLYFNPLGKYGEPISKGYDSENCGGALIREGLIIPKKSIILNYK